MNGDDAGRVFISYRRSDSKHVAGRIRDRLRERFGQPRVFMDVSSIEPGADFRAAVDDEMRTCTVLLAVIGPAWLSAANETGRRLDDPDDLVVLEIEAALRRDILVIPVLVDDAAMPRRADLPQVLGPLAQRHALRLDHETFDADHDVLVARLDKALRATDGRLAMSPGPAPPSRVRAASATRPVRSAAETRLNELELADYEFLSDPPEVPAAIRTRTGPNGTVLIWPKAEVAAATVLYRVVSADDRWSPYAPQTADLVTVTESTRCVDPRPFTYAVRQVEVWVHGGRTREEAAAAEPVKHAECIIVAPVTDAWLGQNGRQVVAQWRLPPGADAVEVRRVPWERSRRQGHSSSAFRLPTPDPSTTCLVDDGVQRNHRYVYELSTVVELDGQNLLSDPVKVDITVVGALVAVTDLDHRDTPGSQAVHLTWTTPAAGDVRIYRTQDPPAAGSDERPLRVKDLPDGGLADADEIEQPIDKHADGVSTMADVAWPVGRTSAYLTPVTVLGDTAAVGPSRLVVRVGKIDDAKIVERTHRQIVTFAWPDAADAVLAYVGGPMQATSDALRGQAVEEIGRRQYERQGGMYFSERLPPLGCSVHLEPVAWYGGGHRATGPIVRLIYPGLLQFGYRLHVERDKAQKVVAVRLQIFAEAEQGRCPWFTLVHRPDRLPLHERDGQPLPMRAYHDQQPKEGPQFRPSTLGPDPRDVHWYSQVNGLAGYLRLFVCQPTEGGPPVALFDPPIEQLSVTPPPLDLLPVT